jgi:hypothetical protein
MLKHQRMEQTHPYVNAGRGFSSFDPDELKALWSLAVKKFWATRTHEAELELNNELQLRSIIPALLRVREEFKIIQAEAERDLKDRAARVAASRAEAWTSCACSLQYLELMAQDNKFEQEVKALAEPRPRCRKPSKDPPAMNFRLPQGIVLRRMVF